MRNHKELEVKARSQKTEGLMSVRTITDQDTNQTVFYDSRTMRAFGPVFESPERAEAFLTWLGNNYGWYVRDIRELQACQLDELYVRHLRSL